MIVKWLATLFHYPHFTLYTHYLNIGSKLTELAPDNNQL